jgi:hypothetical protein
MERVFWLPQVQALKELHLHNETTGGQMSNKNFSAWLIW